MTFRWEELFIVEWQAICIHLSVWTMMDHGFMVINRVRLNVVAWKLSGPRKLTNVPFSKGPFQKGIDRLPTIIFWRPLVTIIRIPLLKPWPRQEIRPWVLSPWVNHLGIPEVSVLPSAEELCEGLSHLSLKAQKCQSCVNMAPRVDRMKKNLPSWWRYIG